MKKTIVITGWVLSGIGKGIAAASIGAILKDLWLTVFCQKFDGYLNVDPGTMSPFQHGEVFVTHDWAETDLDLWHYERFLDCELNKFSSFTTGKIYEEVIARERRGDYLGGTVQIIPHVTNLVQEKMHAWRDSVWADVSIIEIGGTVGDIENEYLLESVRQLQRREPAGSVFIVHVGLVPFLGASKELKTKPLQHSVRALMSYGLTPDIIIARADRDIPEETLTKIAESCGLPRAQVFGAPTLPSVYDVPLSFHHQGMDSVLSKLLLGEEKKASMSEWQHLADLRTTALPTLRIGLVGKYSDLEDAYFSVNEWLRTAGFLEWVRVQIDFIDATEVEKKWVTLLTGYHAICIPGGFGERGIQGMILAAEFARTQKIPYLGICLGSQIMGIEFARNVLGLVGADSQEFDPTTPHAVIHIMESQKDISSKWGTMRLGSYPCHIAPDTLAHKLYDQDIATERHRHRFEFNPFYREQFNKAGFITSALSPDGSLAEIVELRDHPFMIATQAHPEFLCRPGRAHPLFAGVIAAGKVYAQENGAVM